jgi:hypothetical protein
MEWSDVQPLAFPATNSFLYVNQDAGHNFLYLLYDFPFRTTALAATDSVHINFDTVSQDTGVPALEEYDIYIFGNGQIQVMEQGKPIPPGRITGAAGFGMSPNSATPHVLAELQVPLTPGPPTAYSPDPLFWGATVPPTPPQPPPPPPPPPCTKQPGKILDDCQKNAYRQLARAWFDFGTVKSALSLVLAVKSPAAGVAMGLLALACFKLSFEASDKVNDPPDPNFMVIDQPVVRTLPSQPFTTAAGLTQQEADALNAVFTNVEQTIALEQASITAINRAQGAMAASNATWVNNQTQAALNFGGQAGLSYAANPALMSNLVQAFQSGGVQVTFNANDIRQFQSTLAANGFSAGLMEAIGEWGFGSVEQAQLLQAILSTDPQAAAALGTGAFPQMLADPSTATAVQQLAAALVRTAPSSTSLTPSFQITLPGDYVAAGVGLRGASFSGPPPTSAPITITGIPGGATIVKAFLYWGTLDNGLESSLLQLNLNGTPVTGALIGSGPDTCWGRTNSFTFRADVTPLVTGNGTYTLTGVAGGGSILQEGASLVVVYQADGLPLKTVILADGNISIPVGTSTGTATFSGFTTGAPVTGTTTFMVGDGQLQQGAHTAVSFTGSLGTLSFPNLFGANNGPLWDTDTFDVSSIIGAGSSSDTATVSLISDCVLWSAQAFSVTSVPATTPITATSAVVQANSNGDTVVKLRGLKPSDAPTIQEQIQMVVQSRTIQNPSISGPVLTAQLVNGLVNDGIITSGQANTIENAVVQQLVVPVGPPAISGSVAMPTVHALASVEVDVQLKDTGPGNAVATTLTQVTLKTLVGSGSVTLNSPTLPVTIGNIAVGASSPVPLFLNIPSTVKRFTITENGSVQDTLNRSYSYSTSQTVFVQ